MPPLIPSSEQLGLVSPALGPWFDNPLGAEPTALAAPGDDLSVSLTLPSGTAWLPPATGTLSMYVQPAPSPAQPRAPRLPRGVDGGAAPFGTGHLVALFTLLPEVEARLDALLSGVLGPPDGRAPTAGTRSRARVRTLALELLEPAVLDTNRWDVDPTLVGLGAAPEQAQVLGLRAETGTALTNGPLPMSDLKRAGRINGAFQPLLIARASLPVKLWAFDPRGRPVDAGAVAAWWQALANAFLVPGSADTLWAPGLSGADQRTHAVQDARTVHLVNAHLAAPVDGLDTLTATNATGTGQVRRATGAGVVGLSLPAPAPDAPVRRLGLLPQGRMGTSAQLWPATATAPARDFVRVALVDVEQHLLGHARSSNAVMTRTPPPIQPSPSPVLLDTTDEVISALVQTLAGTGERTLLCSTVERDLGALLPPPLVPGTAPITFPLPGGGDLTVEALRGGGTAENGVVTGQRVLVTVRLGTELAGAWVRIWPQGFDRESARHFLMDGGAGPVRADGQARVVVTLPDGDVSASAPLSLDVLVVARAKERRHFAGLRFQRPAPVGGAPVALASANAPLLVCELNAPPFANAAALDGVIPSGASVVALSSPPALVDRATIPNTAWTASTLSRTLNALRLELTPPAFRHIPPGEPAERFTGAGATVRTLERVTLSSFLGSPGLRPPAGPLPAQERLEVVAGRVDRANAQVEAVIGAAPCLSRYHELLPHPQAHPGAPGAPEVHGTGVRLVGPAAVRAAELLRERIHSTTPALATAAATPLPQPAAPANATVWTAVLQTVAAAVEGEAPLVPQAPGLPSYPFGQSLADALAFLSARIPGMPAAPPGAAAAASVARALDRRVRVASRGVREGWASVLGAIERAQDFVYIETPAFDPVTFIGDPELETRPGRTPWHALIERLSAVPGLHAFVCLPVDLMPGLPSRLARLRDELFAGLEAASTRVVVFSPATGPGRSLRLASTTVIVDDVHALTGTTHLSRRGLTFDSSVAVAAFDEQLVDDRAREVRDFRRALMAGRLGVDPNLLPDEPLALFDAIRRLVETGGRGRLAVEPYKLPDTPTGNLTADAWNPDGSPGTSFDFLARLAALLAGIQAELEEELPLP
ncbi:hypothetical protein EJ065_6514 [Corallococcus coralloides]|uniref:Uncharacterized protein n=1 Tax=Corallococcus coralloides TaxID=184914 RepID=A0A410S1P6_CORCK|nr:hypothetical protein [Corallococcus coralloides]QAT88043.1 hypothetical protein EJ065_6514 [Corallococcus coralloides]